MQLPSGLTVLMFSSVVILSYPGVNRVSCEVRLTGGLDTVPNAGRVEIRDRNTSEWLAVCDDRWDTANGQVVCRELGYPGADRVMVGTRLGDGALSRSVSGFQCYGTEIFLDQCTHSANVDAPCGTGQAAEVICKAPGYIGCFRDGPPPRGYTIFNNEETIADLTTEKCLRLARRQGGLKPFIFAGTEDGSECWYGLRDQDFWSKGNAESQCDDVCEGNVNQICGARDRLSMYDANLGYCDDPGTVSNGNRTIRHSADDFYFGTIVEFACDSGFELQGTPSIQCTMGSKRHGVEWSNNIPDCLAPITQPSTQLPPVPSERTETEEQAADTGACAGIGAAVAFGIFFLAALVGIGYWKMSTNNKNPQACNRNKDKTARLAKLSLNDGTGDDKTAQESRRDAENNQTQDSGWVDSRVYESSINPIHNPDIYQDI